MYLMFGDEADHEGREGSKYFLYGGIFIPSANAEKLHNDIAEIRRRHGFSSTDNLKFATNTCPQAVSRESHTAAKIEVIESVLNNNVKFSAYVFLHEMAKNIKHDTLVEWGINSILGSFNKFLKENSTVGISILDRIPVKDQFKFLREKFCLGLYIKNSDKHVELERIISHSVACNNASNFSSVIDVLLGSFRYCVNEEDKDIACKSMLPSVVKSMWCRESQDGRIIVREYGLLLRPKKIKIENYKAEYDKLIERLNTMLQQKNEKDKE